MLVGLNLFASFVVPLIAILVWLTCLIRLRSAILWMMTLAMSALMLFSTSNPLLVTTRNPYFMLVLLTLLIANVSVLPHLDKPDKPYLIVANGVVLVMLMALHAWTLYLRQTDLYFYEQSAIATTIYSTVISLMSLSLPLLAFFARSSRQ